MKQKSENSRKTRCKTWNIAIYIRLSREDIRSNYESESITNQRAIIEEHIAQFDDGDIYNVVREYVDDGYSGTTDDRQGFQEMLHDIEAGSVNCVIVKDLARSFRNYSDQGYYLDDWFPRHQVRFISLYHQALDTYKERYHIHSIMVPIQGVLNENHCAETSAKVREVFDLKRSRGEYIGGFGPYGYIRNPANKHELLIDPEAADVVKDIFQKYASGMSKRGIVYDLNKQGILCPSRYKTEKLGLQYYNPNANVYRKDGKPVLWSVVTVDHILKNRCYCGDMVQGRQRMKSYKIHIQECVPEEEWFIVENTHEAIIDRNAFDKVQTLLQKNTYTKPETQQVYLFSGFLKCGDCGKSVVRSKVKTYVYYFCQTYKSQSKHACTKHTIRHDALEQAVLATIQQQIYLTVNPQKLLTELQNTPHANWQMQRTERRLKEKRQELERFKRYKREAYQDWKDGELDLDDYRDIRREYEKQVEEAEQIIVCLQDELKQMESVLSAQEGNSLSDFMQYQNVTVLTRALLTELVEDIVIYEGGKIKIIFRFADSFRSIVNTKN